MRVYCYPDDNRILELHPSSNAKKQTGPINRFFKNLMKDRADLWAMTKIILEDVDKIKDLEKYKKNKIVAPLKKITEPIYEFRIPPTKRGGVVRLYFSYMKNSKDIIMLLSAEIKHGKKADPVKIKQAKKRYKEKCK